MGYIILAVVLIIVILFVLGRWKRLKLDSISEITGGVGAGKSSLSVKLVLGAYKKKKMKYKWNKFTCKLFHKENKMEEPLIYSNVPLYNVKGYTPLTDDLIRRKTRFNYNSVIYFNEASLVADHMNGVCNKENDLLSQDLTMFVKLIRHETKGSGPIMFLDTQSPKDLHYCADRAINSAIDIVKSMPLSIGIPFCNKTYHIGFGRLVWVRVISLRQNVVNTYDDDVQETLTTRCLWIPNGIFKKYDTHCYSFLTDNKKKEGTKQKLKKKLGWFHIVTFARNHEIKESNERGLQNEQKENR